MREECKVEDVRKIKKGGNYVITKNKRLNEMTASGYTKQAQRFLFIYLGMINPLDLKTRKVAFTLENFQEIMEIGTHLDNVEAAMDKLMNNKITVKTKSGVVDKINLFTRATLCNDKSAGGGWIVEMSASEEALEFMFNQMTGEYFRYSMWNPLGFNTFGQMRLYEWLKQHEWAATKQGKTIAMEDLRAIMEVGEKYKRYGDFKEKVLEVARAEIGAKSDIEFAHEIQDTKGQGGKVQTLRFTVKKKPAYTDQPKQDKQDDGAPGPPPRETGNERQAETDAPGQDSAALKAIAAATENLYTPGKIKLLHAQIAAALPEIKEAGPEAVGRHVAHWHAEARERKQAGQIKTSEFAYLKSLVKNPVPGSPLDITRKEAAADRAAAKPRKTAFHNFKEREYDWDALEKMEREYQKKRFGFDFGDDKAPADGEQEAPLPK